tara:strand:+ start:1277 stop:1435 length:159 start_codon:yes stop_codon:yes gene_type:complete
MTLPGNQKEIDANKDGKITREDLKMLRNKKRPVSLKKKMTMKKMTREKKYEN